MPTFTKSIGRSARSRAGRRMTNRAILIARTPEQRRKVIEFRTRLSRIH